MSTSEQHTQVSPERLAEFIRDHGFAASVHGNEVKWDLPWSRKLDDGSFETGIDVMTCSTVRDAREQLGY